MPSVGNNWVAATWSRVVLPAPFGPITTHRSSSWTVQVTSRSSIDPPRLMPTPRKRITSSDIPLLPARHLSDPNLRYGATAGTAVPAGRVGACPAADTAVPTGRAGACLAAGHGARSGGPDGVPGPPNRARGSLPAAARR